MGILAGKRQGLVSTSPRKVPAIAGKRRNYSRDWT
jgi:hypothetical protein